MITDTSDRQINIYDRNLKRFCKTMLIQKRYSCMKNKQQNHVVPLTERRILRNQIRLFVCYRVKRTLATGIRTATCVDTIRGNSIWITRIRGSFASNENGY